MQQILIVEDDDDIAEIEKDYLEINNYQTTLVSNGSLALQKLQKDTYDLVILDIMLPDLNGFQICKEIRKSYDIPILMVTAKNNTIDKIKGLGFGADDYLTKPFDPAELVARVKSHIARYNRLTKQDMAEKEDTIQINTLCIYKKAWKVSVDGKEVKMANREFELLVYLAEHPNIVFSKEQLFEQIWGFDYIGDSTTVAVHINRIRDKIEENPSKPQYIETIWGAGYRFNV